MTGASLLLLVVSLLFKIVVTQNNTGYCPDLETYNPCASPCVSRRSCQYQDPIKPTPCVKSCEERCECNGSLGLIRDKPGGKCVPIGECDKYCGPNQTYGCKFCCPEKTCTNPSPPLCRCLSCTPQCVCKSGYIRNARNGECVLPENCTKLT